MFRLWYESLRDDVLKLAVEQSDRPYMSDDHDTADETSKLCQHVYKKRKLKGQSCNKSAKLKFSNKRSICIFKEESNLQVIYSSV